MVLLHQCTGMTEVYFMELDLADLTAVKKAAETFLR
jgi:hypothetical protein